MSPFRPAFQRAETVQKSEASSLSNFVCRPFTHAGESFIACQSGALYWPGHDALLVADLHLEKGSAFASKGQFLPPYDSQTTLSQLEKDIAHFNPRQVICLGDSFHDIDGPYRLSAPVRMCLDNLTDRLDWTWIIGNHDPVVPDHMGGMVGESVLFAGAANRVTLCHEPGERGESDAITEDQLEICGHLHPVATIHTRGRSMRRKCFVLSPNRIILPAYGSYTGGLNIRDEAFRPFMTRDTRLIAIGRQTITQHDITSLGARRRR